MNNEKPSPWDLPERTWRDWDSHDWLDFLIGNPKWGIAIFACLFIAALTVIHSAHERGMENGYAAWLKLTGNPKNLTLEEWESLVRSGYQGLINQ